MNISSSMWNSTPMPANPVRTGSVPEMEHIRNAPSSEQRIKSVCTEMESLFLQHLMKEMRSTVQKSGLCGGGKAEEIFTSLMDTELARELSKKGGGIGLGAMLETHLMRKTDNPYSK